MSPVSVSDITPFLPELFLIGGLLALLIIDLVVKSNRGLVACIGGCVLLLSVILLSLGGERHVGAYLLGSVTQDGSTQFFRVFFAIATIISLGILVFRFPKEGEPYFLIIASVLGMFLLAGANDIITLIIALELVSIPSYVLAGYNRQDVRSGEASLKYVLYGAFSSGLMIYGFSLFYGLSGTTNLPEMAANLARIAPQSGIQTIAFIMVLAGLGYKIALVPMHFWCPDVYEGSPTAITAFFSVAPKAAGLAALLRVMPVFIALEPAFGVTAVSLITFVSALTMTFGNLGALWQTSLKRLLAYSSISHAGFLLMGFAVMAQFPQGELHDQAVHAVMFYLAVYLFMNLGAFLVVDMVDRKRGGDSIRLYRGLGKSNPIPALLLAVCLFSLTGLPPLAGFVGKFFLFAALVKGKMWALAIIGIANTVVALFYYVRVIRDMFLYDPLPAGESEMAVKTVAISPLAGVLAVVTVVPTLVLGVFWGPLAEWIQSLV